MTDVLAIKYAVLTDATEDCTGLWEAVWEYIGLVEDEAERVKKYAASIHKARQTLEEFISNDMIVLERCSA